jgi:O-antigen/teichoic acid export membrane protein
LFLGIGFMVPLLAGLRYDLASVIVDKDRDAGLLIILTILLGTACALIVLLIAGGIHWLDIPGLSENWKNIAYAYAPYIFFNGVINAQSGWAIRKKHFVWMMMMRLSQPIIALFIQYFARDVHVFGNGLILGNIGSCGILAAASIWILWLPVKIGLAGTGNIKSLWQDLRAIAVREKSFPLFSLPYAMVGNFASQAVVVALGAWYPLSVVGLFNMAFRTLNAPMILIGSALGQSIMPSLSAAKNNIVRYEKVIVAFMRLLGWIHIPPLIFIIFHGHTAYRIIFGAQWAEAGEYAAILSMAMMGIALTMWLERIFDILGKQKFHLGISTALNGLVLLMFILAHIFLKDPDLTIAAWSFGTLLYYLVWITIVFKVCGFDMRLLAKAGVELTAVSLITTGLVYSCSYLPSPALYIVGITGVFTAYGLALWFSLWKDVGRIFNWKKAH